MIERGVATGGVATGGVTTGVVATGRGGASAALRALVSFPVACFTCALATDIVYSRTANMMWADFSTWLLAVGMVGGGLAALLTLVLLFTRRRRPGQPGLVFVLGGLVVLAFALANNFVHSRDAWTSVVPEGLVLSAATVLVMILTGVLGRSRDVVATRYVGVRT